MRTNVAAKLSLGFGITLLIFILVGVAGYQAVSALIAASELRRQTFITADRLDEPLALLTELELGTRSYYLTGDDAYADRAKAASDELPDLLQSLRALPFDGEQQRRLDALEPLLRERFAYALETLAIYRRLGTQAAVARIAEGPGPVASTRIRSLIDEMQTHERNSLDRRSAEAEAIARSTRWTLILGTLAGLLAGALAAWLLTREIAPPLGELTRVAERISQGDMQASVAISPRGDEVGALSRSFECMTAYLADLSRAAELMAAGNLRVTFQPRSPADAVGNSFERMSTGMRDQLRQLAEATDVLAGAAGQIVGATAQFAASASESAAAVAETTATAEEVRQTAELAAQEARSVAETAQRAVHDAVEGRKSTEQMAAAMMSIRQQMNAIVGQIARLSDHGQSIGQIIAAVEDLAVQSNLLAVNAAIEAAKAGEHGRGFGVVAQEVKSLAAQSRAATIEVRNILGDIETATAAAAASIRQGEQAVELGSREAEVTREAIEALAGSIGDAARAAAQIAASSRQQLTGVDQLATAMESMRQNSTQNIHGARDLESAARDLDTLGQKLQQITARYQV